MATSGFGGTIESVQLPDAIQLICMSGRTAALTVSVDKKRGTLYFQDGNIVHADYDNLIGEDAFFEIISWKGGEFALAALSPGHERTITESWQGLLLEVARRNDEQKMKEDQDAQQEESDIGESDTEEEIDLPEDEADKTDADFFDFSQPNDSEEDSATDSESALDDQPESVQEFEDIDSQTDSSEESDDYNLVALVSDEDDTIGQQSDEEEGTSDAFGAFDQLEEDLAISNEDTGSFDDRFIEPDVDDSAVDEESVPTDPFDTLDDIVSEEEQVNDEQPEEVEYITSEFDEVVESADSIDEDSSTFEKDETEELEVMDDFTFEAEERSDSANKSEEDTTMFETVEVDQPEMASDIALETEDTDNTDSIDILDEITLVEEDVQEDQSQITEDISMDTEEKVDLEDTNLDAISEEDSTDESDQSEKSEDDTTEEDESDGAIDATPDSEDMKADVDQPTEETVSEIEEPIPPDEIFGESSPEEPEVVKEPEQDPPQSTIPDFVIPDESAKEQDPSESLSESVIGTALDNVVLHYMKTWPEGADEIRFDTITSDLLPDHIYRHFLCRFLQLAMQVIHLDDMPFDFGSEELSKAIGNIYEVLRNNWMISHDYYRQIIYDANYFDLTRSIDPARAISQFLYERTENDADQMIPFLKAMIQNELVNSHYNELLSDLKQQEDPFVHPRKVENFIRTILDRRSFTESYKAIRVAMQHLLDIVRTGSEHPDKATSLIKISVVVTMLESRGLVNIADFVRVEQKIGKEALSISELDGIVERYHQYEKRNPSRRRRELSGHIKSGQFDSTDSQHDVLLSLNKNK